MVYSGPGIDNLKRKTCYWTKMLFAHLFITKRWREFYAKYNF